MKGKNNIGLKLLAGLAFAFLVIECIILMDYFFIPKKEVTKLVDIKKTDSVQNKISVQETHIKSIASLKDSVNTSKKKDAYFPPVLAKKKPTPEIEKNTEKLDEGIVNYEQLNDQISQVNYFITNLLTARKTICNKGENNKKKYKAALIATYANLIKIIPEQTNSNFAQFCNFRNDLEYAMKKLDCTIDSAIQKKLKEKC